MPNRNFEKVVLVFLRDRLVERHVRRCGLDRLLDAPDVTDGYANHLRAAALVGAKAPAFTWLQMGVRPGTDHDVPEALWFYSKLDWDRQPLTDALFRARTTVNAFHQPLVDAAQLFEDRSLTPGSTDTMFRGVSPSHVQRARDEPGETIWVPFNTGWQCVEGNARMHALALGLARGTTHPSHVARWSMWVGRP